MGEASEIMKRMRGIDQECDWIAEEINFLNNKVDKFKARVQTIEAELNRLQEIQDSVTASETGASYRLAGLMQQRRRHLVEIQYALPSTHEELKKLEALLINLQEEAIQLSISLSFTSMNISSAS